jgi:hypothetical protein
MEKYYIRRMPRLCLCLMFAFIFIGCAEKTSVIATPKTGWELEVQLIPQANLTETKPAIFRDAVNAKYSDLIATGWVFTYRFRSSRQLEECRQRLFKSGLVAAIRVNRIEY